MIKRSAWEWTWFNPYWRILASFWPFAWPLRAVKWPSTSFSHLLGLYLGFHQKVTCFSCRTGGMVINKHGVRIPPFKSGVRRGQCPSPLPGFLRLVHGRKRPWWIVGSRAYHSDMPPWDSWISLTGSKAGGTCPVKSDLHGVDAGSVVTSGSTWATCSMQGNEFRGQRVSTLK